MGVDISVSQAPYKQMLTEKGSVDAAIGYGNSVSQQQRHLSIIRHLFGGRKDFGVLEIGCGVGGTLQDMIDQKVPFEHYMGVDVMPEFLQEAKKRFVDHRDRTMFVFGDMTILHHNPPVDFIIVCGAFDYLVGSQEETLEFIKSSVRAMYRKCNIGIGFDFFLPYQTKPRDTDPLVNPADMLHWLRTEISERALIDMSFAPHAATAFAWKEQSLWRKTWEEKGGWK